MFHVAVLRFPRTMGDPRLMARVAQFVPKKIRARFFGARIYQTLEVEAVRPMAVSYTGRGGGRSGWGGPKPAPPPPDT